MRTVDYREAAATLLKTIKQGAFLTVQAGDALNTMTIGWATIGLAWRRPVLMVMVRASRHTFGLIETSADFTVSLPTGDMRREITFCGTHSGRDVDKFAACALKTSPSRTVFSPVIRVPGLHFECRIVYKSAMDAKALTPEYAALYADGDYHTLYFGEIQSVYETD